MTAKVNAIKAAARPNNEVAELILVMVTAMQPWLANAILYGDQMQEHPQAH